MLHGLFVLPQSTVSKTRHWDMRLWDTSNQIKMVINLRQTYVGLFKVLVSDWTVYTSPSYLMNTKATDISQWL